MSPQIACMRAGEVTLVALFDFITSIFLFIRISWFSSSIRRSYVSRARKCSMTTLYILLCPMGLPFGTGGLKLTRSKNLLIALCARKRLSRNHHISTQNRWKWSNGVGTSSQELGRYGKAVTPPQRKVAKNTLSGGIFKCVFKTYVQEEAKPHWLQLWDFLVYVSSNSLPA